MAAMVTLELNIKPEKFDEFLGIMAEALKETRAYDGCQKVETYVDQDVPGRLILLEWWDTRGHQEKYMQWRTDSGMMEALADYVAGPPTLNLHDHRPEI